MEYKKYSVLPVTCQISSKNTTSMKKPSRSYYDISFSSTDTIFNYIIFCNFYVASITIKQYIGDSQSKAELEKQNNWCTILPNYKLMKNAHFEGDAQNWHIIGTELFNSKFDRNNCSLLRIYLHAPSPSWLDFYLKNISVYYKKASISIKPAKVVKRTPFEEFRSSLKKNLKMIKQPPVVKGEKSVPEYDQTLGVTDEVRKIDLPYSW